MPLAFTVIMTRQTAKKSHEIISDSEDSDDSQQSGSSKPSADNRNEETCATGLPLTPPMTASKKRKRNAKQKDEGEYLQCMAFFYSLSCYIVRRYPQGLQCYIPFYDYFRNRDEEKHIKPLKCIRASQTRQ